YFDNDIVILLVFFFSSRRRHTRFSRDWSSDVCSSDLFVSNILGIRFKEGNLVLDPVLPDFLKGLKVTFHYKDKKLTINYGDTLIDRKSVVLNRRDISHAVIRLEDNRSEERRVGKECRY